MSGELEFEPSLLPLACSDDITVLQNTVLEAEERFFVSLNSSDSSITISPTASQVAVVIQDDDSKLVVLIYIFTILTVNVIIYLTQLYK